MAFISGLCLLFLFAPVHASKHPGQWSPVRRTPEQEKAARELVATLLRERSNDVSSVEVTSGDIMQWIPASSLEAQQDGKSHEEAEREIRTEFEEVLGKDLIPVFEEDLVSIQKELQPTFNSLAKNEYGELGFAAVRYALHRLFVARHGWYIRGIDPEGGSFNESSPSEVLKGHVPDNVQQLIEKLLYGRGFGLSEVSLLGAILENVIHQEATGRAGAVYNMFDVDPDTKLAPSEVDHYIDLYMSAYIMGQDVSRMTQRQLLELHKGMDAAYPGWEETRKFTHRIREEIFNDQHLGLSQVVTVLGKIGERHGRWQHRECLAMKDQLMALEDQKDGCVPLANFYKGMREEGKWQFSESPDYLRELGDLDESDPQNPRVMVSNYIDGISNCVASSSYYSVCCINECEEILGRVEKHFQAPDALPEELARVVAALPSSTVPSQRSLPAPLLQQLGKIAAVHNGRVPLHSRLFMQWMHNAYPHECPYPHAAGKTSPRLPEVWMAQEHKDATASLAQMSQFSKQAAALHKSGQCGQWLDQEELYVPWEKHPFERQAEDQAHAWVGASSAALLAALASMILVVMRAASNLAKAGHSKEMIST